MHGGALHGEGAGKLEVVFVHLAFFAGAMNADDAGGLRRGEEGEEVGDEAGADVVAEGDGVF